MMNLAPNEVKDEFEAAFGFPTSQCNLQQLWFLAKFAKHVRGRCRSNVALYNYLNACFPNHSFRDVQNGGPTLVMDIKEKI